MDSGIDGTHPHFRLAQNLDLASTYHEDFTSLATPGNALSDEYGHGTHVSGIIAGEQSLRKGVQGSEMSPFGANSTSGGEQGAQKEPQHETISGMAPKCQTGQPEGARPIGQGAASNIIAAIAHIQEINGYGRRCASTA